MLNQLTQAIAEYQWVRDRIITDFPDIERGHPCRYRQGLTTLPEFLPR